MVQTHKDGMNHLAQTKQQLVDGIQAAKLAMDWKFNLELKEKERRVKVFEAEYNMLCQCEAKLNMKLKKSGSRDDQVSSNQN